MKNQIPLLAGAFLILVFSYTALSKVLHFSLFRYQMRNQPFPRWLSDGLTWILPLLELAIVVLLLRVSWRCFGLLLSFGLMLLFTVYTGLVLSGVFHRIPCSCGGLISSLNWTQHFILNILLSAGVGLGFFYQWRLDHTKDIHR